MIRAWVDAFWSKRLVPQDSTRLHQRNIYILPTRAGWGMALTIVVLLITSINYQLNLGYAFAFLLAGSALVGMHMGHGTLRGLTLRLLSVEPQFAGADARIFVRMESQRRSERFGIGLAVRGSDQWSWQDVPAQGSSVVELRWHVAIRGLHPLPSLSAQTHFPLGTFRVWTVWRPAAKVLVYPSAEVPAPPLPLHALEAGPQVAVRHGAAEEYDGVRPYRRGDPLKALVWKKAAKSGELVSRASMHSQGNARWLDLAETGSFGKAPANLEARLSRLCAWVLAASANNAPYGLRLENLEIPPDTGEAHRLACLRALALFNGHSA